MRSVLMLLLVNVVIAQVAKDDDKSCTRDGSAFNMFVS